MMLIVYRIAGKIPVVLIGETVSGKTALIRKLNQLLNNGKESLEIVNVHPGATDKILTKRMNDINKIAKNERELWVFFDELNTCNSLGLITDILINRSYNGVKLSDSIRLIGACNPCRRRKDNKAQCGLRNSSNNNDLVYLVKDLPQSLMYYVFNFGSIGEEDEKKYISSIISKFFEKKDDNNNIINDDYENKLKIKITEIIFKCRQILWQYFDRSVVSLRELSRFTKVCEFFMDYYKNKRKCSEKEIEKVENEITYRVDKLKSIINSVYLCYFIRLVTNNDRTYWNSLKQFFIELVNCDTITDKTLDEENNNKTNSILSEKINEPMKSEISKIENKCSN